MKTTNIENKSKVETNRGNEYLKKEKVRVTLRIIEDGKRRKEDKRELREEDREEKVKLIRAQGDCLGIKSRRRT